MKTSKWANQDPDEHKIIRQKSAEKKVSRPRKAMQGKKTHFVGVCIGSLSTIPLWNGVGFKEYFTNTAMLPYWVLFLMGCAVITFYAGMTRRFKE